MTLKRANQSAMSWKLATSIAGALAVLVGGMVLVGWALDIVALKSILPGWVTMKPNTALAFMLTGIALLFSSRPSSTLSHQPSGFNSRLVQLCALPAGLIGLLTLSEYVFGWNPGIDQWLFRQPSGAVGTSHPGRMAPDTALCFVLLAAALWLAAGWRKTKWTWVASTIIGSLVTTVALATILAYFTPALRTHGWWDLTMMAPPTAALFAVLGAAMVLGSWQDSLGPRLTLFSSHLWRTVGCIGALAIAFTLYARSGNEIYRAHELRDRSFLLADELRQSVDDLPRMVRTYVVTGDPVYKQHFQDILDIRDGKKPRPEDYWRPYWDLMLGDGPAPRGNQQAIPLLELMRQAGFTEEEFRKLAEAKVNSDGLTIPEVEAMKLVESTGPEAEANRTRARMMMFDPKYHQAKITVMGPIHDFLVLVDKRTLAGVRAAEKSATIFRYLLAVFGLGLMLMLWRTCVALGDTLGGSLDEVYAHITKIGSGNFSAAIQVKAGLEKSILGWLSETQTKLNDIDRERKRAEEELSASEERFRIAAETTNDVVYEWDLKQSVQWLGKIDQMLGYEPGEFPRTLDGWAAAVHPEDVERVMVAIQAHLEGRAPYAAEYRVRRKDGIYRWWSARGAVVRTPDGKPFRWIGTITDITERKRVEEALALHAHIATIFLTVPDDGMYEEVLKVILEVMHSPVGVFGYLDEAGAFVMPTLTRQIGDQRQVPEKSIRFPRETWGDSAWSRAIREKRTIHSNEPSISIPADHVSIRRHISMPILMHGEVVGLFLVANKETDYTEADLRILKNIAVLIAPILDSRLHRQWAGEALQLGKTFLESVINAIADPVFVKDDQRRFVLVNDASCASIGRPKEVLLGEVDDMFPEGQVAVFREVDALVLDTGKENVNEEIVSNLSTGELRTVVTRKSRFIDPEGKRFLVGVIRDITERKQAEVKIAEQMEELRRWQEVMLGREDRVQELKVEINELCRRSGEAVRYPSQEASGEP